MISAKVIGVSLSIRDILIRAFVNLKGEIERRRNKNFAERLVNEPFVEFPLRSVQ